MLLGIGLHAALAFFPTFWPVQDSTASSDGPYGLFFAAVHGFRMPLFFLLSGFFTTMLWRRRGLPSLLKHRLRRIVIPLAIGMATVIPLTNWIAEKASADQFNNLITAVFFENEAAVGHLLDGGANPNEPKGQSGDSPLHLAALVDNAAIAELLLNAGADPFGADNDGDTPFGYAYFAGSEPVADALIQHGFPDVRPAGTEWTDLDNWGFGAEEAEELLELDSWITSLYHLWFLWFLVLLVAGFAVVAIIVDRGNANPKTGTSRGVWRRRTMWALVPLSLIPQLAMGEGGAVPVFGPDTSAGLIPVPHVLFYYAVFFAFGALLYNRRDARGALIIDTLGRRWMLLLPLTLFVVFPVALGLTFDGDAWGLASLVQIAYTWGMIVALIGAFRTVLAKERRGVRYLSDSSYWLYLAHLPLLIVVQSWIRDWDMPSGVKFLGVTTAVTAFLLGTYQLFVRYTPLGTMLNGKRTRPGNADTAEVLKV